MIPKYLFIDDESGASTKALLDGFNDTNLIFLSLLTIERNEPFESVCNKIKDDFINLRYDGVLIDLCLDGTGENSLSFKAQPFAQQLRTWASEMIFSHFPIVLCSTIENYDVYKKDRASHDLFDYYIDKTDISFKKEATRLNALVEGYQRLSKKGIKIEESLNRADIKEIDENIIDYLSSEKLSPFDLSHRLIKDVFRYSGLLIDEAVLAARMGVDVQASGENWNKMLRAIENNITYTGVFSSGWHRFWADKVNRFFMEITGGCPYQILTANERVDFLRKAGFIDIVPAKPIHFNKSTYFNTVCESSRKPLDSMEGIPIEETMLLKPWQQNHYVSFYAVAKGDYSENNICLEGLKKKNDIKNIIENEQTEV